MHSLVGRTIMLKRFLVFTTIAAGLYAGTFPDPATDITAAAKGKDKAVFAGGCFWGVDAVFKHVKGVTHVVSGYSGGQNQPPNTRP